MDLKAAKLTVRRALTEVGGVVAEGEPKTDGSRRELDLPPATVALLKRCRTAQKAERLAHGVYWQESDLVFADGAGEWLRPSRVSSAFIAAVKTSGLPTLSLHGLRHTWATIAIVEHGVDVVTVSKQLGHSNVSTTLNSYSHALAGRTKEAACAVASGMVPVDF